MLGIILAGGCSTRTKLNKLLLEVNNRALICHAIDTMRPFVEHMIVVTGKYHDELLPVLEKEHVEVVFNNNYESGMFSSIMAGINRVQDEDILLLPGDTPNVSKKTYESLLHAKGSIRIPSYKGHDGHPLFLVKRLVYLLKKEPDDSNMHIFLDKHEKEKIRVEVDDKFVCFDVDYIDDYNKLRSLMERK